MPPFSLFMDYVWRVGKSITTAKAIAVKDTKPLPSLPFIISLKKPYGQQVRAKKTSSPAFPSTQSTPVHGRCSSPNTVHGGLLRPSLNGERVAH